MMTNSKRKNLPELASADYFLSYTYVLTRHAMKDAHANNPAYYLMPSAAYTVPFLNTE
ncbi:MAG: hypothetical protein R6W89_06655 [Candidatus Hydrogenedentota bacterium]